MRGRPQRPLARAAAIALAAIAGPVSGCAGCLATGSTTAASASRSSRPRIGQLRDDVAHPASARTTRTSHQRRSTTAVASAPRTRRYAATSAASLDYQDERDAVGHALLRRRSGRPGPRPAALAPPTTALIDRLEAFARAHPSCRLDPDRGTPRPPADRLFARRRGPGPRDRARVSRRLAGRPSARPPCPPRLSRLIRSSPVHRGRRRRPPRASTAPDSPRPRPPTVPRCSTAWSVPAWSATVWPIGSGSTRPSSASPPAARPDSTTTSLPARRRLVAIQVRRLADPRSRPSTSASPPTSATRERALTSPGLPRKQSEVDAGSIPRMTSHLPASPQERHPMLHTTPRSPLPAPWPCCAAPTEPAARDPGRLRRGPHGRRLHRPVLLQRRGLHHRPPGRHGLEGHRGVLGRRRPGRPGRRRGRPRHDHLLRGPTRAAQARPDRRREGRPRRSATALIALARHARRRPPGPRRRTSRPPRIQSSRSRTTTRPPPPTPRPAAPRHAAGPGASFWAPAWPRSPPARSTRATTSAATRSSPTRRSRRRRGLPAYTLGHRFKGEGLDTTGTTRTAAAASSATSPSDRREVDRGRAGHARGMMPRGTHRTIPSLVDPIDAFVVPSRDPRRESNWHPLARGPRADATRTRPGSDGGAASVRGFAERLPTPRNPQSDLD